MRSLLHMAADLRAVLAEEQAIREHLAQRARLPASDRFKVVPGRVAEGYIAAHAGALSRERRRLEHDIACAKLIEKVEA